MLDECFADADVVVPIPGLSNSGVVRYVKGDPMSADEYDRHFGQPKVRTADGPSRAKRATTKES